MTRINYNDKIPKCQGGKLLMTKYNEKIILIESDYFEYLDEENDELVWKKIKIESLPFIPIIITSSSYKKENKIIYNLIYELPYSHEYIMTNSEETIITEKNENEDYIHTTQIKLPNDNYNTSIDCPIRLDNQNIDILKRIRKKNDIPLEYISKKRNELFKLNELLDKSISLITNHKTLKKETPK